MSSGGTRRKQRVAPPAGPYQWEVRCGSDDAGKGWDELSRQAAGNARQAWEAMSHDPVPLAEPSRHHRLKGSLTTRVFEGRELPLWQIEVTSAARVWYLVDEPRGTVWIVHAGVGHPKSTE